MKRPAAAIERPEAAAIEQLEAAAIKRPQARRARCGRSAEATAVHDDDDACGRMSLTLEDAVSGRLPKNAAEYTQHVEPLIQRTVDKRWYEMTEQLMDVEYHQLWLASAVMEETAWFQWALVAEERMDQERMVQECLDQENEIKLDQERMDVAYGDASAWAKLQGKVPQGLRNAGGIGQNKCPDTAIPQISRRSNS